jgi:hypothetical protein
VARFRLGVAALGTLLAFGVPVGPAAGHSFTRTLEPVLDRGVPSAPGVSVELRTIVAPALFVRNDGRRPLEVIGVDGRPFVRIGPRGVEANVASPDLYRSNAPVPGASVPAVAQPDARPVWVRVARKPAWSWFEHRLDPLSARASDTWAIPVRLGGRNLSFRGRWKSAVVRGVFRTVVEGTRPRIEGISVDALANGPALLVQNTTSELLEIADGKNRPFLRVGPAGVELRQPGGSWTKMGKTPAWAWLESRAAGPRRDWSIDAKLGGQALTIFGHVEWVPVSAHHRASSPGPRRDGLVFVLASTPLLLGALYAMSRRAT